MKSLRIIFVDQLSSNNPTLEGMNPNDILLFYEPIETFYEIKHHKQKITLLVSALRHHIERINHKNVIHQKIEKNNKHDLVKLLIKIISDENVNKIIIAKPSDFKIYKDLMFFSQSSNIELEVLDDRKFISSASDFSEWASDKKTRIQEYYYRWLRKNTIYL